MFRLERPYKMPAQKGLDLLGGSWVVISRVISRVTIAITYIRGLIAPLTITIPMNLQVVSV